MVNLSKYILRKATAKDASQIADLMLLAMDEIVYYFIQKNNKNEAHDFLTYFIEKEDNQYSYQNIWVYDLNDEIVASINLYDGNDLHKLREPILNYLNKTYTNKLILENETQSGEIYIDTLAVKKTHQGMGLGQQLLEAIIEKYAVKIGRTIGLLVETDRISAQKLYVKLGFKFIEKKLFTGKEMNHLQYKP